VSSSRGYENVESRLVALTQKLLDKTTAGAISWQATDSENAYSYSTTRSSVLIDGKYDNDQDFVGGIEVLNDRGTAIERLRTDFETKAEVADPESRILAENTRYFKGPYNELIEDLFEAARRSALDIDGIIDGLMSDLEEEG